MDPPVAGESKVLENVVARNFIPTAGGTFRPDPRRNAIRPLSGDQAGENSDSGVLVNCTG